MEADFSERDQGSGVWGNAPGEEEIRQDTQPLSRSRFLGPLSSRPLGHTRGPQEQDEQALGYAGPLPQGTGCHGLGGNCRDLRCRRRQTWAPSGNTGDAARHLQRARAPWPAVQGCPETTRTAVGTLRAHVTVPKATSCEGRYWGGVRRRRRPQWELENPHGDIPSIRSREGGFLTRHNRSEAVC